MVLGGFQEGPACKELNEVRGREMPRGYSVIRSIHEAQGGEWGVGLEFLTEVGAPADQHPTTGLMSGLTRRAQAVTKSAGALTGGALDLTSEVTSRASAAASGITRLSGAYLGDASRAVARPVTIRISALSDALAQGSMSALVFGGLASLIFPPLAPFLVGEAILSLPLIHF